MFPLIYNIHGMLRRHGGIIALIIFVALIYSSPHFIFQKRLATQEFYYSPFLTNLDERHFTAAKVNAVFRDGVVSGDINLYEHRNAPYIMPPIPHLIMGYLSRALGSVKAGFIAGDIIFPALSFFLLYFLGLELTQKKTFAALFASICFFATRAFLFFPLLTRYYQAYILNQIFSVPGRLYFDRFEDPLLTTPFFFLALYLLLRSLTREEPWTPWLAGISAGLLFYVYFYYAVYFFVALGIIAIFFLLQKNKENFKKIIKISAVGLSVSSLYWINFLTLTHLPTYTDIVSRLGPEHSYALFLYLVPAFAYLQHTTLALILYLLLRRESPARAAYLAGILLPVFVVYNFQIITGFNPQPDHWIKPRQFILTLSFLYLGFLLFKNHPRLWRTQYLLPPALLAIFFLVAKSITTQNGIIRIMSLGIVGGITMLAGAYIFSKRKIATTPLRFTGILSLVIIMILCAKGFLTARAFTNNEENRAAATIAPNENVSYRWLNSNTPPGSVIGSISAITNDRIQLFTANKLFISGASNTIASNQELLTRFMLLNRLWGVDPTTFGSYFPTEETYPPKDEDHSAIGYLFGDQYRAQIPGTIFTNKGYGPPKWSDKMRKNIMQNYANFLKEPQRPLPYRLDYLYYGPREQALAPDTSALTSFEKIYDQDSITIYRYTRSSTARQ